MSHTNISLKTKKGLKQQKRCPNEKNVSNTKYMSQQKPLFVVMWRHVVVGIDPKTGHHAAHMRGRGPMHVGRRGGVGEGPPPGSGPRALALPPTSLNATGPGGIRDLLFANRTKKKKEKMW